MVGCPSSGERVLWFHFIRNIEDIPISVSNRGVKLMSCTMELWEEGYSVHLGTIQEQ